MNTATKQHNWSAFLNYFSEQNRMRSTRVSVFEGAPEEMEDYWLEDGLPLAGIDIDTHGKDLPTIEIMLGDATKASSPHMTHVISGVRSVKIVLSASGEADGLEIADEGSKTTILQFEN